MELYRKVIVLGNSGSGKTSLLLRYVKDKFQSSNVSIGATYLEKGILVQDEELPMQLQLWDTSGMEKYSTLMPSYY
jgi:Ras-related protein Rab-7A